MIQISDLKSFIDIVKESNETNDPTKLQDILFIINPELSNTELDIHSNLDLKYLILDILNILDTTASIDSDAIYRSLFTNDRDIDRFFTILSVIISRSMRIWSETLSRGKLNNIKDIKIDGISILLLWYIGTNEFKCFPGVFETSSSQVTTNILNTISNKSMVKNSHVSIANVIEYILTELKHHELPINDLIVIVLRLLLLIHQTI